MLVNILTYNKARHVNSSKFQLSLLILRLLVRSIHLLLCYLRLVAATGVHISRGARSIRRRVLPVRDVRRLHGTVAGTALQLPVSTTNVRRTTNHHADSLHAYLRHHRQKVARLPAW